MNRSPRHARLLQLEQLEDRCAPGRLLGLLGDALLVAGQMFDHHLPGPAGSSLLMDLPAQHRNDRGPDSAGSRTPATPSFTPAVVETIQSGHRSAPAAKPFDTWNPES